MDDVILDKLHKVSDPQFSHLKNGNNKIMYFTEFLWRLKDVTQKNITHCKELHKCYLILLLVSRAIIDQILTLRILRVSVGDDCLVHRKINVFPTQRSGQWDWMRPGYKGERSGVTVQGQPGFMAVEREVCQGDSKAHFWFIRIELLYILLSSFFLTDMSYFIPTLFPNPIPGNPLSCISWDTLDWACIKH